MNISLDNQLVIKVFLWGILRDACWKHLKDENLMESSYILGDDSKHLTSLLNWVLENKVSE
jgi:hypothetical protein